MTSMDTNKDISSRADIDLLIRLFYDKVRANDQIGIIFNEVVPMDWEHHIPVIVDFWETILLDADKYHKNAMEPHFAINKKFPLLPVHFQAWVQLFVETVEENFTGEKATLAINRARGIAGIMQIKMDAINTAKS